jgi:hypothetical protein
MCLLPSQQISKYLLQEKYPDLRWMDTQNGSTAELIQFFRVVETVI